jgi:hypothetical protein
MSLQNTVLPHPRSATNSQIGGIANDNAWDLDADFEYIDGLKFENGDVALQKQWAGLVLKNLKQSAVGGSGLAQSCLSYMYLEGFGVKRDPSEAFKWCSAAAEQKDRPEATYELATMYLHGVGVEKCKSTATSLFDIAGKQDHSLALFRLAKLLVEGSESDVEVQKGFKACYRSAELGLVEAQFNLGVMLEDGLGTKKNLPKAASWYRIAANNGNKRAMNNLGNLYWHGKGVDEDRVVAEIWYSLALDNGSRLARFNLEVIKSHNSDNESAKSNVLTLFFSSHSRGIQDVASFIKSLFI